MEFISAEEFLKQPKEVQKVILDWWKPQQMDLYIFDRRSIEMVEKSEEEYILPYRGWNIWQEKKDCIPLFTEGQLRKFIEDKTGFKVDLAWYTHSGYDLELYNTSTKRAKSERIFENLGHDLLQAYWKVACEIAKESVENEYK